MKVIIAILSLLLLACESPAFSELTKEDLRAMKRNSNPAKEEIGVDSRIRTIIKEEIAASEKRTRTYDLKIETVNPKLMHGSEN